MRRPLAAAMAVAAGLTLAACSSGHHPAPDPAACKSAMRAAYLRALASPSASPAAEPAACKGIPQATLSQFATQIMGGR